MFEAVTFAAGSEVFLEASISSQTGTTTERVVTEESDSFGMHASSSLREDVAFKAEVTPSNSGDVSSIAKMRAYIASLASSTTISFWQSITGFRDGSSQSKVEDNSSVSAEDLEDIRIAKIGDLSATLTWSLPKLSNMQVYYASTSPVIVSEMTAHVSPWKMWNRNQVTLRGLTPDTTYFYKVVVSTKSGTTTSAEARFKTLAR